MQKNLSLSIDIGGTSAKYAYVTADGKLTGKDSFPTSGLKNLDEFYQHLLPVIDKAIACGAVNVGLSCPGFIQSDGLCMGGVENLPYLKGVNIPEFLRQHNPSLKVSIMNDGTAAALGEYWLGSGPGQPCPAVHHPGNRYRQRSDSGWQAISGQPFSERGNRLQ